MSGTENTSSSSTPFVLRGSSPIFSQRQQDAFGCLQALEEAHNKVTKETKAERNLVKKMAWRPARPVAESLEAEKDAVGVRILFSRKSLLLSNIFAI